MRVDDIVVNIKLGNLKSYSKKLLDLERKINDLNSDISSNWKGEENKDLKIALNEVKREVNSIKSSIDSVTIKISNTFNEIKNQQEH